MKIVLSKHNQRVTTNICSFGMHVCGTMMKPARGNNSTSRNSSDSRGKWKKTEKKMEKRGREGGGTEGEEWRVMEREGENTKTFHPHFHGLCPGSPSHEGMNGDMQVWDSRHDIWSGGQLDSKGLTGLLVEPHSEVLRESTQAEYIHEHTLASHGRECQSGRGTIKVVKKTKVKFKKKAQTYERNAPEIKQSLFLPEAATRRCTLSNKVLIWRKITKRNPTSMSKVREGWVK